MKPSPKPSIGCWMGEYYSQPFRQEFGVQKVAKQMKTEVADYFGRWFKKRVVVYYIM